MGHTNWSFNFSLTIGVSVTLEAQWDETLLRVHLINTKDAENLQLALDV